MKKKKNKVILAVLGILLIMILTIAATYGVFTYNQLGETINIIKAGTLDFVYTENTKVGRGISLTNAYPISDEEGKKISNETQMFDFTIEGNNGSKEELPYEITLKQNSNSTLANDVVKVYLSDITTTDTEVVKPTFYSALDQTLQVVEDGVIEKTLYQGTVPAKDSDFKRDFRLRMWVDENTNFSATGVDSEGNPIYPYNNKTFTVTVNVYSSQDMVITQENSYKDSVLNGADPVLKGNLIPVKIASDGTVTKADTTKEWYNYTDKEWANAVITRNSYDVLNTNGKVNGATLNDGYVSFDGTDDFVNLGLENHDFGNTITMAIKFTPHIKETDSTGYTVLFGNPESAGAWLGIKDQKTPYFQLYCHNSTFVGAFSTKDIIYDKENILVGTYDGTTLKVFLNGEEVGSKLATDTIIPSSLPMIIGGNPMPNNKSMENANMDVKEVMIFDRALSTEEIQQGFTDDIKVYSNDGLLSYVDFSNEVPENNEIIPESNIESYFVWIPRYKYKIFDEGNYTGLTTIESKEQTIEILFENKNITPSNGQTKGTYLTHPAFTSFDSNGFWVGKFETGYDGATSTGEAHTDVDKVDVSKITIKPNIYSWRNISIGNMFKNSYDYQRNLDSHMMKNTEWGAVVFLQQSKYGINSDARINNNNSFITGYSAAVEPTLGTNNQTSIDGNRIEGTQLGVDGTHTINYLNQNSVVSSTTGNYTGIYDMSGGAWDYVMGYTTSATTDNSGITSLYSNFFNNTAYTKYWDKYTAITNTNYNNRILGDATGEIGPFVNERDPDGIARPKSSWYKNYGSFISTTESWFRRGGACFNGIDAGSSAFYGNSGGKSTSIAFRIVLTPQGGNS